MRISYFRGKGIIMSQEKLADIEKRIAQMWRFL